MPLVDQFNVAEDHFVFAGPQVFGNGYVASGSLGVSHHRHVAFDHQRQVPDVVPLGLDQLAHHVLAFVQRLFALVLVRLQSQFLVRLVVVDRGRRRCGGGGGGGGGVLFL